VTGNPVSVSLPEPEHLDAVGLIRESAWQADTPEQQLIAIAERARSELNLSTETVNRLRDLAAQITPAVDGEQRARAYEEVLERTRGLLGEPNSTAYMTLLHQRFDALMMPPEG
jgi:hypothetical protein